MEDDLDFKDYIGIVKRYWGWVLIAFLIVFAAITAYTYLSEPIYEATSLVVLANDQANFILGSSAPKTADIETNKVIIQSSGVMEPIYSKYGFDTFKLTVTNIKNSNIIEINVQANNPADAVAIANDIASNYINYTRELRKAEAEDSLQFIAGKIDSYDRELSSLDLQATNYKNNEAELTREQRLEYQNIQREITAKTKIYDYLLNKREEAGITANIESSNVKIIQQAIYPELPVRPNKALNLVLGFMLALGAGAITATLIDSRHERKRK